MSTTKKKSATLKIKWIRSFIGCPRGMRQTIRGLGFRRMHQIVEHEDTPEIRGMIAKVHHLVEIESLRNDEAQGNMEHIHLSNLKPPRGSQAPQGARGPRHGLEDRQNFGRGQQGTTVPPGLFAAPRL